ncbi:MAG: DUF350 domain-containing protein [Candidatus Paceibacterota bacterium]
MNFEQLITGLGLMVPYSLMALIAIALGHVVIKRVMIMASGDTVPGDNIAAGIRIAGFCIAMGIGMSGVFVGKNGGFWHDLEMSALYSAGLILLMIVALKINDLAILSGVQNSLAIANGNVAVAAVEFGGMIATGLIAKGSVSGDGSGWETFVVFFVLGQGAMVLMVKAYARVWQRMRNSTYSLDREVERGNIAAGIVLGGKLWAYGLIMSAAVTGKFVSWNHDLVAFAVTAVAGMIFLYVSELLVDKLVVTGYTAKEIIDGRLVQPALVLAAGTIGMAYVISTVAI